MYSSIEHSILKTLVYADIFDYPLAEHELWKYYSGKRVKHETFRRALEKLVAQKRVHISQTYYTLPRRRIIIPQRLKRQKIAREKLIIAQKAARFLSYIPTVWFVGLSGALAMQNAPIEDDIDLFIITAPNTLWTTRLLATILLDVFSVRRKPGETHFKNKICLNMFMDASSLRIRKKEQDLYSAHEIAQLKLLVNKHDTYERFLIANTWAKEFLPHAVTLPLKPSPLATINRGTSSIELSSKRLQLWYMQKRKTTEVIQKNILRFHPHDAREWVMEEYRRKLSVISSLFSSYQ